MRRLQLYATQVFVTGSTSIAAWQIGGVTPHRPVESLTHCPCLLRGVLLTNHGPMGTVWP